MGFWVASVVDLVCISVHNMSRSLFRLVGAIGRTWSIANIVSGLIFQVVLVLGGFIVSKGKTSLSFYINY